MSFAEYIAGVQTMVHVIVSLLHDRDCIYGAAFRQRVREMGIRERIGISMGWAVHVGCHAVTGYVNLGPAGRTQRI